MRDDFAVAVARAGDDPRLKTIVEEVCRVTGMGFAAIACVTRHRWVTCQVEDRIEFGLDPGSELEVQTTICNDIRDCGQAIVIDDVIADERWRRHPTPVLYGFRSYASFPVVLVDGTFFGTLCAIDPERCRLGPDETVAFLGGAAGRVRDILSDFLTCDEPDGVAPVINAALGRDGPAG